MTQKPTPTSSSSPSPASTIGAVLSFLASLIRLRIALKKRRGGSLTKRSAKKSAKGATGTTALPRRIREPQTEILRYAAAQRGLNALAGAPGDSSGSPFAHAVVDHLTSATELSSTTRKAVRRAAKKAHKASTQAAHAVAEHVAHTAEAAGAPAVAEARRGGRTRQCGRCGSCGRRTWVAVGVAAALAAVAAVVARLLGVGAKQTPAATPPSIDDVRPHPAPDSTLVYSTSTPGAEDAPADTTDGDNEVKTEAPAPIVTRS